MSFRMRSMVLGLVLLTSALPLFGASKAEETAYRAAVMSFQNRLWERADRELQEFLQNFPNAENRPMAVLLRAEALYYLTNSAGAIALLESGRGSAGNLADEYVYWLAQTHVQAGNAEKAAELYAQFAAQFPNSNRLLEAIVAEATVRAQLKQWERVTEILQKPDGVFQSKAKETPTQPLVVRGRFLLAKTLSDLGRLAEAETALQPLLNAQLGPKLTWDRDYLLARIQWSDKRPADALKSATQLPTLVTNEPPRVAEGWVMIARCEEDLNHPEQAVLAWQEVLKTAGAPADAQREALLRVSELLLIQNRIAESLQTLEGFLASASNSPVADIAWLAAGELRLREFAEGNAPANSAASNQLASAQAAFDTLLAQFPHSPLVGKAHLGRGWTLWLANQVAESGKAFESATATLPVGYEQMVARFKLADAQAQQKDFTNALSNYQAVVASGNSVPEARTNLIEHALYQILQVARDANDGAAASEAMAKLLAEFPEGPFAESGLLTFRMSDPAARRTVLEDFLRRSPDSKLAAGVRFAIARTYEQEHNWPKAQAEYDALLSTSPEPALQARAQYFQALALARSGDETNALTQFTNFVANFPTNEFTPLARWWVADHYWREEDYNSAERNYQYLFQNHPESSLSYEAQLMAGRAAWKRRPEDAVKYFTDLANNLKCPTNIQAKAMFAYGDMLMELNPGGTNELANFVEAIKSFRKVQQLNPNSEIALLAEGKIGTCYLQLGGGDSAQYENARRSFNKLLLPQVTNVTARSEAEVGLGLVLEKQSLPGATNQSLVLTQARLHYLNVVLGKVGDPPDPFWVKKAGVEALRVSELLQEWEQVGALCDTLSKLLPPLRPMLEKKKTKAIEQLSKNEN